MSEKMGGYVCKLTKTTKYTEDDICQKFKPIPKKQTKLVNNKIK
jgi:hypothetical protein